MGPRFPAAAERPPEFGGALCSGYCRKTQRTPQTLPGSLAGLNSGLAQVPAGGGSDLYGAGVERRPGGEPVETDAAEDRRLLQRHVDGDPEAFGLLFRRHGDRLWAVALRTLNSPEDAADAVQNAMISAYRRAETYRGDAAVTTWLHRIVVNACLDLLRRRNVRPVEPLPADPADPVPHRDPIEDRQTRIDVAAALASLPVEQRVALILVDVEGYPVAEVALMLEVPSGTVKSRCARGRARLAVVLTQYRNQTGAGDVSSATSVRSQPPPPGKEPAE